MKKAKRRVHNSTRVHTRGLRKSEALGAECAVSRAILSIWCMPDGSMLLLLLYEIVLRAAAECVLFFVIGVQ